MVGAVILALVGLSCIGLGLYLAATGRWRVGVAGRPMLNLLTIYRREPTSFHPTLVRIMGVLFIGLGVIAVALASGRTSCLP